jgi:hypothetical protein
MEANLIYFFVIHIITNFFGFPRVFSIRFFVDNLITILGFFPWKKAQNSDEIIYKETDAKNPRETKKVGDYVDYEEID